MKKSTRSSTIAEALIDTSGFYALLVSGDRSHSQASELIEFAAQSNGRFVTTDYILDETATLLRARGHGRVCQSFFETAFASAALRVEWMDSERFMETRRFFLKHHDQAWSFTDCFSFFVMHSLGLRDALTADAHFRQAGFNPLLA